MHLDQVPRDVQHLSQCADHQPDNATDLDVWQCDRCGLVQTAMLLDRDYYDDYFMTQTHSTQLNGYLDDLVESFITTWCRAPCNVLDVGCGDGAFMAPFRDRNIAVRGIEPSAQGRARAQAQGYIVYPGYISADTDLPGAPYDVIVSRQVLEHVADISGFLQGVRRNLTRDGHVLIEVPRLEKALVDLRFYDFFPDHVNYFTQDTLALAAMMNGFQVLETKSTMYDEYNVAVLRAREPTDLAVVKLNRDRLVQQIQSVLQQNHEQGVAIWGAGAKGLSIMSNLDLQSVAAVVDSDPNKIGRYTPGQVLIQDPVTLMEKNIGHVIISAVAFQRVILTKLREMNYRGQVYTINHQGLEHIQT
jgi:SAM-dependent methyltransferase